MPLSGASTSDTFPTLCRLLLCSLTTSSIASTWIRWIRPVQNHIKPLLWEFSFIKTALRLFLFDENIRKDIVMETISKAVSTQLMAPDLAMQSAYERAKKIPHAWIVRNSSRETSCGLVLFPRETHKPHIHVVPTHFWVPIDLYYIFCAARTVFLLSSVILLSRQKLKFHTRPLMSSVFFFKKLCQTKYVCSGQLRCHCNR